MLPVLITPDNITDYSNQTFSPSTHNNCIPHCGRLSKPTLILRCVSKNGPLRLCNSLANFDTI